MKWSPDSWHGWKSKRCAGERQIRSAPSMSMIGSMLWSNDCWYNIMVLLKIKSSQLRAQWRRLPLQPTTTDKILYPVNKRIAIISSEALIYLTYRGCWGSWCSSLHILVLQEVLCVVCCAWVHAGWVKSQEAKRVIWNEQFGIWICRTITTHNNTTTPWNIILLLLSCQPSMDLTWSTLSVFSEAFLLRVDLIAANCLDEADRCFCLQRSVGCIRSN